jgi:hypothetical protein
LDGARPGESGADEGTAAATRSDQIALKGERGDREIVIVGAQALRASG